MNKDEAIICLQGLLENPLINKGSYLAQAIEMAIQALSQEPCDDIAQERYKDLCEYFGGAKDILKSREDFKAWLGRVKWHIRKAEELYEKYEYKKEPCEDYEDDGWIDDEYGRSIRLEQNKTEVIPPLEPCERFEWGIDGNVYKITKAKDGKEICQQVCDDTVSRGVFEQVMGERDIAIEQLHELGYEWGQKIEPLEVESAKLQQAYDKGFEACRQAVLDYIDKMPSELTADGGEVEIRSRR